MTHNEIASTIRSNLGDALDGNLNNQAYSLEQLLEEIDLMRADFAHKYAQTSKLDPKFMVQKLDLQKIVCRDLADDCVLGSGDNVPSVKIPKILPIFGDQGIQYIGLNNMQEDFAFYFEPDDIQNHKVRIKTRHRPYIWVDTAPDSDDMLTLWFFNWSDWNPLEWIRVRGIFEHPMRIHLDNPEQGDNEYPAPLHMQKAIVEALTEKYVRYYRQLNTPKVPNTQSDNIT